MERGLPMSKEFLLSSLVSTTLPTTERGILLNDTYYSCGYAIQQKWFSDSPTDLQIYYSPHDLNQIYVRDDDNLLVAYALNPLPSIKEAEVIKYHKQMRRVKERLQRNKKGR
jgi:hypothetical protein